jgi:aminoglycoside phosphotransferase (APT) family kinase protein
MSPIKLPDRSPVSPAALRAIVERHGLTGIDVTPVPLPQTGMINTVYALGQQYVLRVPRNHPGHVAQLLRERLAVPAARAADVRTPALVAFDEKCDILPVPYAIYERIAGTPFELLGQDVRVAPAVWRELGRDLGRLHAVANTGSASDLAEGAPMPDPRDLVQRRAGEGWFTTTEASWLLRWLERLAPAAREPVPKRLIHADTQPTNVVVVSPDTRVTADGADGPNPVYHALIDWGCAQWGDDAVDIACAPLGAAPFLLEGHRQIAPLAADESAEARVLWHTWQIALDTLPRGAVPGFSWGENPTARVIETLRFFAAQPGGRWHTWRPEA